MHFNRIKNRKLPSVHLTNIFGSHHLQMEACSLSISAASMGALTQPLARCIGVHCHDNRTVGNFNTAEQPLIQQCEGRIDEWSLCSVEALDLV